MHLMNRVIYFLASAVALAFALENPSHAQPIQNYRCKIERVATAEQAPNTSLDFQQKNYLGKEFTVERRTGLMAGAIKNSYTTKPQVIDIGSTDNSYKVVTTMRREQGMGAGSNVYTLVINEYEKTEKKSFLFIENDNAYFGKCIHF